MDDAHDYDAIWRGSGAAIWRAVYAYAGGRRDVADDAVSEAFARMMARGAAVREPEPYLYRVAFRVASTESLDFWHDRVGGDLSDGSLVFTDPEGLSLELVIDDSGDEPLVAKHPEIPDEHALRGFAGVRAYTRDVDASRPLLEGTLGFEPGFVARGDRRSGFYVYDEAERRGVQGAGTVHHVAWASTMEDHEEWRTVVERAGARPTPVIDRFYFRSIYFREPSGVLFEIATLGPGFTTDEPLEHLGERLSLPPDFEHLRDRVEPLLTPLPNPRAIQPPSPAPR